MKMFASDRACTGVDTSRGGRYDAKGGFITVDSSTDVKALKQAGFVQAGMTPKSGTYWHCECGWDAWINHCPRCDRDDLTKVVA